MVEVGTVSATCTIPSWIVADEDQNRSILPWPTREDRGEFTTTISAGCTATNLACENQRGKNLPRPRAELCRGSAKPLGLPPRPHSPANPTVGQSTKIGSGFSLGLWSLRDPRAPVQFLEVFYFS
jgi:hypothetical protein